MIYYFINNHPDDGWGDDDAGDDYDVAADDYDYDDYDNAILLDTIVVFLLSQIILN